LHRRFLEWSSFLDSQEPSITQENCLAEIQVAKRWYQRFRLGKKKPTNCFFSGAISGSRIVIFEKIKPFRQFLGTLGMKTSQKEVFSSCFYSPREYSPQLLFEFLLLSNNS
jgi:hypothetical protein